MVNQSLTHKDLAGLLNVSETTVKSYRRKFPGCIPVASNGKPIRFKPEAAEICLRIRDLFIAGMSVEEVTNRLSKEFKTFIKPIEEPIKSSPKEDTTPKVLSSIPDEASGSRLNQLSVAISGMAKSMVSLGSYQNNILVSMNKIEGMFKELGLKGFDFPDMSELHDSLAKRESTFTKSVDSLQGIVNDFANILAENNSILAENKKIQLDIKNDRELIVEYVEKLAGMSLLNNEEAGQNLDDDDEFYKDSALSLGRPSKILKFKSSSHPNNIDEPIEVEESEDIPRHFFSMPVVVKMEEGGFISAGGKLGRISLNDIKAILLSKYLGDESYTIKSYKKNDGWWIIFEQPYLTDETRINIKILVKEVTSTKGVNALAITKLVNNDEVDIPGDFFRFINMIRSS